MKRVVLGFAHLSLPDGSVAGVVDVPGHERFVRAMAAGAGGVDLVVLVVAADEGVMPQTREHLDICRLLGVPRGLVAVTKADLLPGLGADWLPLLEQDVRTATKGTFLEASPIVPVSATTREGLDRLVAELGRLAAEVQERPADGPAFLPIDRAFSMKGFGTVVTGTLLSGQIAEGDETALLPPSPGVEPLRVRSVQVHGKPTPRALAGQRTAVNLAGVDPAAIRRGQALVHPGVIPASAILDVELTLLAVAARPLRHRARLLLHVGTAQVSATVALLDRGELAPGATALAQLRLGSRGGALLFDRDRRAWVAGPVARDLASRLVAAVDAFHRTHPLAAGMGREELRGRLPPVTDARLFQRLLAQLGERGELVVEGDHVRRKGHEAAGSKGAGAALKDEVAAALRRGGLAPPRLAELPAAVHATEADVQAVLKLLAAEGRAVRVSAELWYDAAQLAALRARLVAFLRERKSITTQEFKDLVGATRKHVIPLAEHFDQEKITLRVGEKRVLRGEGRA